MDIQKELQEPVLLRDRELYMSASMGISLSSTAYNEPEDPLRDADTAMYRAKAEGTAGYAVFDPSMHKQAVQRLQLENDLRRALERGELRLHYQPIVALQSGALYGFEALLRWEHPERGLVFPGEFLPVAEETELILPITEWVMEEACRQVRNWQAQFPTASPFSVSTNLSARFFTKRELLDRILTLLSENGLEPSCLHLEITESQILSSPTFVARTLNRLSEAGIQVHIDDFGTGYSSLGYLSTLHVHGLKIDQSFIAKLGNNDKNAAIVSSMITLGENLGLDVIAEGVETGEQLEYLKTVGCPYAQGFYFARGMEPEKAGRFLRESPSLEKMETHFLKPGTREHPEASLVSPADGNYVR